MKKFLLIILLFLGFIIQIQAHNDTLAVLVWVEDAVGNRDSVFIYLKGEATDGSDPELGEVNLYGTPPQSDLDLRIIQRTDTNYLDEYGTPYWLTPLDNMGNVISFPYHLGWCASYKQNVDLKKSYVNYGNYSLHQHFIVYCHAKYYPIKIFLRREYNNSSTALLCYSYAIHDTTDGHCITSFDEQSLIINESEQNWIINFGQSYPYSIKQPIEKRILFPNPTDKNIILDDVLIGTHNLIDGNGSILKTFIIDAIPYILDVENLPAGNYFITAISNRYFFHFIKK